MERRTFLRSAGAAAVLPVLPLPAAAAPMAAAPVHTSQVGWAALFARVNNRATPALMQKWLGVGPKQAHALMSELTRQNIIQTAASGGAVAVQPMHRASGIPGVAKTTSRMIETTRDVWDALTDDPDTPTDNSKEATDETS